MKAILTEKPLWWHNKGLQQTASGYGRKLTTAYVLECEDGLKRRLYCCCYSNIGTCYVLVRGEWYTMQESFVKPGDTVTVEPLRKVTT